MLITYMFKKQIWKKGLLTTKILKIQLFCYPCQRTVYYDTSHLDGTKDLLLGCISCHKAKIKIPDYIFQ